MLRLCHADSCNTGWRCSMCGWRDGVPGRRSAAPSRSLAGLNHPLILRIDDRHVLGMAFHISADEWAGGDDAEFVTFGELQYSTQKFRTYALASEGVGDLGVNQAKGSLILAVENECRFATVA